MSYKRILVAIDESKTSCIALYEAIPLAQKLHAELCIVTVVEDIPSHGYISKAENLIKHQDKVKTRHEMLLDKMQKMVAEDGMSAEIILIENSTNLKSVSEKIIEVVKTWKADLLVVGTHSRRGVRRFLLGSTAEEALRNSPIPVLLIPSNEEN